MHRVRVALVGLLLLASCIHEVSYDPQQGQRLQHVAIVVRVKGSASADVPDAARAGKTPAEVSKKIEHSLSNFETAERIRSGLVEHLPDAPPWNSLVPTVQAETVLGGLLPVEDTTASPDLDALQQLGVDGVLYVEIDRWGARTENEQGGMFLHGTGKFVTLPDHDTLWQGALDTFGNSPLPGNWLDTYVMRDQFGALGSKLGEQIALQLGGTQQAVSRTPSLESPDIEDKGHPPERMKPVIPFVMTLTDAGAPPDAGGLDIAFGDGGMP